MIGPDAKPATDVIQSRRMIDASCVEDLYPCLWQDNFFTSSCFDSWLNARSICIVVFLMLSVSALLKMKSISILFLLNTYFLNLGV